MTKNNHDLKESDIAIIGMSCRFPGANTVNEFWENLKNGVISIKHYSDDELLANEVNPMDLKNPNYVRAKGTIDKVEYFDASFFNYSGREAEILDPQIRLLTELSWEALENSGYVPQKNDGNIGLYVGVTNNLFWQLKMIASGKITDNETLAVSIYCEKDHVSTRIAYKLNLCGPAFTVETQCSTSLVAFHLACQGLLTGDCEMALAGGASVNLPSKAGYVFQEGSIHSSDGFIRAFDSNANGTIFCDGGGVVILKKAIKALEDGDTIYAIVKGTAINNDGNSKAGYTAPSIKGQTEVIKAAFKRADINPETISYVETHGTGTAVGDPIEIEALTLAFNTNKKGFCKIGSVKPNIGHLDNAAGIANIIKTTLALIHKQIPPTVNYHSPNPRINFEETPFVVNHELSNWEAHGKPRRAGVSSYGVGGTNAHVLMEEAPQVTTEIKGKGCYVFPFSARSESALKNIEKNTLNYILENYDINIANLAYTLQLGRDNFEYRSAIVCDTKEGVLEQLQITDRNTYNTTNDNPVIIFLFPGQGSQYVNMGIELYEKIPAFRDHLNKCLDICQNLFENNLKDIIFSNNPENDDIIYQTQYSQTIIFVFEYALAKTLMGMGIIPGALMGHSIGEYTAACIANVFSLEDAIRIVKARGELMQKMPAGSMLAVLANEAELNTLLPQSLSIAAVNSNNMIVVSGETKIIDSFAETLSEKNIESRKIHTSHAFHSAMMDNILSDFEQIMVNVQLRKPEIPYISNLTGDWINESQCTSAKYWVNHLRNSVLFRDGIEKLLKLDQPVFIEVGPGNTLSTFVKRFSSESRNALTMNVIKHSQENKTDLNIFLNVLSGLWLKGIDINWNGFYQNEVYHRIPLPTYPFERKKYWVGGDVYKMVSGNGIEQYTESNEKFLNRWIYKPSWKLSASEPARYKEIDNANWIIFNDECGFSDFLHDNIDEIKKDIILVNKGQSFKKENNLYTINHRRKEDYELLLKDLKTTQNPDKIVILHFWTIQTTQKDKLDVKDIEASQSDGLFSILSLIQATGKVFPKNDIHLKIISNNIHNVLQNDLLYPLNATILGSVTTVPLEYDNISVWNIDLEKENIEKPRLIFSKIKNELLSESAEKITAYRNNKRYYRIFETLQIKEERNLHTLIKDQGVYLVTGGLGGIGLEIASYLTQIAKVKLVLLGRSDFPERNKWNQLVKSGGDIAYKIRRIREFEDRGSEVFILKANVADEGNVIDCIHSIQLKFGNINGLFHCAGVAGGNIIQTLKTEYVFATMESKVFGTILLDNLLKDVTDFIVLNSSISSVSGTFGQLSYTASNAFLDAYAHYRNSFGKKNIITFNWDVWQQVGMAVKALKELKKEVEIAIDELIEHPFFYGVKREKDKSIYISKLSSGIHWVLDEHRVLGNPVLPGVSYVEIIRVISELELENPNFRITELVFYTPFEVADKEERELRIIVTKSLDGYDFSIFKSGTSQKELCAKGKVQILKQIPEKNLVDIKKIENRCNDRIIYNIENEIKRDTEFLQLGNRWLNVEVIRLGEREGIAHLYIPSQFIDDLDDYKIHPAIFDMSLNYFAAWKIGNTEFLPFSYSNLNFYAPLTEKVVSHILLIDDFDINNETIRFNVNLYNEQGELLISVEEYTLKKVYSKKIKSQENTFSKNQIINKTVKDEKDSLLDEGILPSEGLGILDSFVSHFLSTGDPDFAQVIVANQNLNSILRKGENTSAYDYFKSNQSKSDNIFSERPDLQNPYEAPLEENEKKMCEFFQDYLKISKVGLKDDFFELGISSLDVAQIKPELENIFGISIPVAIIFENPTIQTFSEFIKNEKNEKVEVEEFGRMEKIEEGKRLMNKRLRSRSDS